MKRSTTIATTAPAHTMAPTGKRKRLTRVRFVNNYCLPPSHYGQAHRVNDDTIRVDLNREVVRGLTNNSRESWLTFFHECAHVVFGDLDVTAKTDAEHDAREDRAERFAEFMISAINDVLTVSVAEHASEKVNAEAGKWQVDKVRDLFGFVPRKSADFQRMTADEGTAYLAIIDATPEHKRGLWAEFWQANRRKPAEHEAFATYGNAGVFQRLPQRSSPSASILPVE